jgi:SAM-dependent methyltransferase
MRGTIIPKSIKDIFESACQPYEIPGVPIKLRTTLMDRFVLGRKCPSGYHEAEMAMWSVVFPGGVWLAHHILNNPELFAGKKLVDIGSGSGIVAIAAAMVGADVTAIDSSPCAFYAIGENAKLNDVSIQIIQDDALLIPYFDDNCYDKADIITAADTFYIHRGVDELIELLVSLAKEGKTVYATSHDEDILPQLRAAGIQPENVGGQLGFRECFVKLTKPSLQVNEPNRVHRRRPRRLSTYRT